MKSFIIVILLFFNTVPIIAQLLLYRQVDSLKQQLLFARQDTTRAQLMAQLSNAYRRTKSDSALLYGHQALFLSRQIKFPNGEVMALLSLCFVQRELGNLPVALDLALKALQIAKLNQYYSEEVFALSRIGAVYLAAKNFSRAFSYFEQGEEKLKRYPDEQNLAIIQMFKADAYEQLNELDSASYYAQLVYLNMYQFELLPPLIFRILGNIQVKLGDNQGALNYYRQVLEAALKNIDERASAVCNDMASLYRKMNKPDSAIKYAKQGLSYGVGLSYESPILAASSLLAELYEPIDLKSALRYHKIADAAKERLYGAEKVQKLQIRTLEEQDRQRDAEAVATKNNYRSQVRQNTLLTGFGVLLIIALLLYRNNKQKQKAYRLLQKQTMETELQKKIADKSLMELKVTQDQLIQSEKMSSLGEITAGIAHEIQNPLNFVNNFSDVNADLITEVVEELKNEGDNQVGISESPTQYTNEKKEYILPVLNDIKENEKKISQHGHRADAIVKSMLKHSRSASENAGIKEPADLNMLCDEYLRLAYHGLRARDKSFNASMETHFEPNLPKVNIIPHDLGRAILNIIDNAFYALSSAASTSRTEKDVLPFVLPESHVEGPTIPYTLADKITIKTQKQGYSSDPKVTVKTKYIVQGTGSPRPGAMPGRYIQITISDNGPGIPDPIKNKIFQPFFTTKPSGSGTGLGLSLAYDIVTKGHGGQLLMETKEGEGSNFIIQIPLNNVT